jgi:hypothetical protein
VLSRAQDREVFSLAVDIYELGGNGSEGRLDDRAPVHTRARSARPWQLSADDQHLLFELNSEGGEEIEDLVAGVVQQKCALDAGRTRAATNDVGVESLTEKGRERVDDQTLARPGLARNGRKPRVKVSVYVLSENEVPNVEFVKHAGEAVNP